MKLIWTYNFNVYKRGTKRWHEEVLIEFYKASITAAKKLGYHTIIYTNDSHSHIFRGLVDEMVLADNYMNSPLFDSFKIKVLEERSDDFYLIDGDLILNSRLPEYDVDVTFDAYEVQFWKHTYSDPIEEIRKLNIGEILPIFNEDNDRIFTHEKVFNCGLLRITNMEMRKRYVEYWKKFSEFVRINFDSLHKEQTTVGAQYILTMVNREFNGTAKALSEVLGEQNEYYRHYVGVNKFRVNAPYSGKKNLF